MRKLILGLLAGALLLPVGSAFADHDLNRKTPPKLQLIYKNEVVQRVGSWSYCWTYSTGEYGVGQCADGSPNYPAAARIDAPNTVTLRIPYSAQPKRLSVWAYRRIERDHGWENTVGPGEKLAYRLKAQREHGEIVAWDAVLRLDEEGRDYFLDVYARLHQGDPSYALHVRT